MAAGMHRSDVLGQRRVVVIPVLRDPEADVDEIARLRTEVRTRRRRLDAVEIELDRLVGDLWAG